MAPPLHLDIELILQRGKKKTNEVISEIDNRIKPLFETKGEKGDEGPGLTLNSINVLEFQNE